MTPVLVACHFTAKKEQDGQYDRLARVLAYTAAQHCPHWDVRITAIVPTIPETVSGNLSHGWNTAKLEHWCDAVAAAPDGTPMVLIDADTCLLQPLDPIWNRAFDLAYTVRDVDRHRLPLNGGLVAVRVSPAVRAAMELWRAENARMVTDQIHHEHWRRKYAGINQASFGALIEAGRGCQCEGCLTRTGAPPSFEGLSVVKLSCHEWNCCEWGAFRASRCRVLHIKSRLRRAVFGVNPAPPSLTRLVRLWHELEQQALQGDRHARSA